jgi:hypothetical protein
MGMITELTTPFVEAKDEYVAWLKTQEDPSYRDLLMKAIDLSVNEDDFDYGEAPDPTRIHVIDDGDYQGTLLFVVAASGYQPDTYWTTRVYYGSCSGCDALEGAWGNGDDQNWEGLYNIALHMMQKLKLVEYDE